jgi:methylated-DNA-[protein]-cysteine S-methyltransferase
MRLLTYEIDGWGVGELAVVGERPVHHELPWPGRRHAERHLEGEELLDGGGEPDVALCASIARWFSGEPVRWEVEQLGLEESCAEWGLSEFQTRAALALSAVPWGERVAYGELALLAGAPRAARAAGSFCAQNRLPLFVPCHRVVHAGGGLGGYGSYGRAYKARLLAVERPRAVEAA